MPEQSGIYFTDRGQGFPIVLIHGFCETHQIWDSFSTELSKNFRVLTLDLPGFGKSKGVSRDFSLTEIATNVQEWLHALKIKNCIGIGHSLGGYVILALANLQRDLFTAFSLFHSTAYADTEERKLSRNKVIEFVSRHGVTPFVESFIPPLFYDQSNPHIHSLVKLATQTKKETLLGYVKAMRDRPDSTDVLLNFSGPILLIGGEKDAGITPEVLKNQANLNAQIDVRIIPDIAHMGMFEKEGETLMLMANFLAKASP